VTTVRPGSTPLTSTTTQAAAANAPQIDTVTLQPPVFGAVYNIAIGNMTSSVTAAAGDTVLTVAARLRSLINANAGIPVTATGVGNIILLTANANMAPFTTIVSGSTAQSLIWTPPSGTSSGTVTPAFTLVAVDGSSSSSPPVQVSVNSFVADLNDLWFVNNLAGEIIQIGSQLTFIDGSGRQTTGRFIGLNQIIREDTNATGTLQGRFITWTNGETWERAIDLSGAWEFNGQPTSIQRMGTSMIFTNESGDQSTGSYLTARTVIATQWGVLTVPPAPPSSGLVGDFDANQIRWRNGTTWDRPAAMVNVAGFYNFNNLPTEVRQNGNNLEFYNESRVLSVGRVLSPTQVVASNWNLVGTLVNGGIFWSNGDAWNSGVGQSVPDISGFFTFDGKRTEVRQNGSQLTFINENNSIVEGNFTSLGNNVFGVLARGWNLAGTFEAGQITWANNTAWIKEGTPLAPNLAGNWNIDGAGTSIEQLGNEFVFFNEFGHSSRGRFIAPNRVIAIDWDNLGGFFENDRVLWANNTVWNRG
jgi:hypothetical protein